MAYWERPSRIRGAVLWQRSVGSRPESARILPDGCLDLLWDGGRLIVAGPDSTARRNDSPGGTTYVGLRFSGGTGPALLGIGADEVVDQSPALDEVWTSRETRALTDKVATNPAAALEAWAVERVAGCDLNPFGPTVLRMADDGVPVAVMAHRLGMSARQLHRRCLPIFGYGPRRLSRVLRFRRALDDALGGAPLAQAAFEAGYVDQSHLNREVRALAGTTPTVLLGELRAG